MHLFSKFLLAAMSVSIAATSFVATPSAQAAPATASDYVVLTQPMLSASATAQTSISAAAVSSIAGPAAVQARFDNVGAVAARLTPAQAAALAKRPGIAAVEPNREMRASDVRPNPLSWGLDRIDQKALPLDKSLTTFARGAGVSAYVVDTGVYRHNDLAGRIALGYDAVTTGGDGTGDCNGHGTHVASTIAGSSYGVAPGATVIPVRVLNCQGSGSYTGVIAGIDWAIAHHTTGPAVLNMSLGGPSSSAVDAAVTRAVADGIAVVVAAGNDNRNACNSSPAGAPAAITVGATGGAPGVPVASKLDDRASYSNYGSCVDIFAPGSNITAAWIGSASATRTISGTSMASPHTAGAVASILERHPNTTPAQVASALATTAQPTVVNAGTGSPNRQLWLDPTGNFGLGPVAPSAPFAPVAPSARGGDKSADVSWGAPYDGGSPITAYTVYQGASVVCSTTATACTVTGLTNGTSYSFSVTASNALGTSAKALTNTAVANPRPLPPTAPTITSTNSGAQGMAQVTWTPGPATNSPVTAFAATFQPSGATCRALAAQFSCGVSGLAAGAQTVTVVAINIAGESPASAPATVTVKGAPTKPSPVRNLTVTTDDRKATVSWDAPLNDGGYPLSYQVTTSGMFGPKCSTTTTSCTIIGLTNGAYYTFTVTARNLWQQSLPVSSPSTRITLPAVGPNAPTNLTAYPILNGADLAWTAPTWPNTTVLGYTVRNSAGVTVCQSLSPRCRVTGLGPGIAQTFTVTAKNVFGEGKPATTPAVTPSATILAPTRPGTPMFNKTTTSAVVSMAAPASDGGSAITSVRWLVTTSTGAVVLDKTFTLPAAQLVYAYSLTSQPRGSYRVTGTLCNAAGCTASETIAVSR